MESETTLLGAMGEWIAGLRAGHLPSEVRDKAELCLLDYIGVALAADRFLVPSTRRAAVQLMEFLGSEDAARDCLVLGFPGRLSAANAALMNCFLGYSVSLDDTAARSMSHTACAVIPALLAISGRCSSLGEDAITAIVAGYETGIRVGRAIMPSHAKRGFHVTATTAPFAAAAVTARLMGLDGRTVASALAIAGNLGSGTQEQLFHAQPAGKLAVARGVQGGLQGAMLAAGGMEGAASLLEGPEGFIRAMSDLPHPERILEGLGSEFEISGVGFKFHAGCRHWHAAADAAIALRDTHHLIPSDIGRVRVHTYGEALRMNIDQPRTVDEARFCAPYAISQTLLGHDMIGGDLYSEEELARPEVRTTMAKVEHVLDPGFEARYPNEWPVRVEITTRDGRVYARELDGPMGEPGSFTKNQILGKFERLATPALGADGVHRVRSIVEQMESKTDMKELLDRLAGAGRA